MKTATKTAVSVLILLSILSVLCVFVANPRLQNKFSPVWEVQGHVLSEQGTPISDVELNVTYLIGSHTVGRMLERGPDVERAVIRPDQNGFFSIYKQCDSFGIRIEDARYAKGGSKSNDDEMFFPFLGPFPATQTTTDKDVKLILRRVAP